MRYLTVYEGQSFLIKRKEDSDKLSAFNLVFICSTMSKNHAKLFLKDHNARNYLIAITRLELGPNRTLCEF